MEYAYSYGDPRRLYLNVTNRCTNKCGFCVRFRSVGLGGALLAGESEPDLQMLQAAIERRGWPGDFEEIIWCGFGEPTYRLDLITETAPWLRRVGAKIRLNTNGHANLIHGRDVLPELSRAVDEVSVSLNAPNCQRYLDLCQPHFDAVPMTGDCGASRNPGRFWDATLDFLSRSADQFKSVQASVVAFVLTDEEIEQCRALALSLGARRFRVR
jgi:TatD DNase family protein